MKTFKQILKELATTDGGYKGPPKTPGANKKGGGDRKSTRLNSSHVRTSRMPSSA